MKALVFNEKVVEISENEFPVSKDFIWVDCDNDVKTNFSYINGVFSNPNYIDPVIESKKNRLSELKKLLFKSDYKMLPDYQERSVNSIEKLKKIKEDRKVWYIELKQLQTELEQR